MQKYIVALFIIVLLSGCAASHQDSAGNDHASPQAYAGNPAQKKAIEESGWAKLEELSAAKCGVSHLPPERDRAVEMSNCITGLVVEYVLPVAAFPVLVLPSRTVALHIAKAYASGKISAAEYMKQSENRVRIYRSSWAYLTHEQTPATAG